MTKERESLKSELDTLKADIEEAEKETTVQDGDVTVLVMDKTVTPKNTDQWIFSNYVNFVFSITNNTAKDIQGMVQQISDAIRSKIDADLVTAMDTDAVKKSATASGTAITSDELMAGMALFGDNIESSDWAGLVINSRLFPFLIAMPEFTSTEKTYASMGNGFIKNGLVGYYLSIPVILCDNNTYDSTSAECKTYMVKKNAVGYIFQKDIAIEEEREAKLLATDIVASSLYATKVIDKDGVVILRKTIAAA